MLPCATDGDARDLSRHLRAIAKEHVPGAACGDAQTLQVWWSLAV
jgi:hypothetical protein